jgi:hypothetical protein
MSLLCISKNDLFDVHLRSTQNLRNITEIADQ